MYLYIQIYVYMSVYPSVCLPLFMYALIRPQRDKQIHALRYFELLGDDVSKACQHGNPPMLQLHVSSTAEGCRITSLGEA